MITFTLHNVPFQYYDSEYLSDKSQLQIAFMHFGMRNIGIAALFE